MAIGIFDGPAVERAADRSRRTGAERVREKMQRLADLNRQKKMVATEIKHVKQQLQEEARRVGGTLILDDDMLICLDGAPVQLDLDGAGDEAEG